MVEAGSDDWWRVSCSCIVDIAAFVGYVLTNYTIMRRASNAGIEQNKYCSTSSFSISVSLFLSSVETIVSSSVLPRHPSSKLEAYSRMHGPQLPLEETVPSDSILRFSDGQASKLKAMISTSQTSCKQHKRRCVLDSTDLLEVAANVPETPLNRSVLCPAPWRRTHHD